MLRMEQSSAVILQNIALRIEGRWWPVRDMAVRMEAARRTEREEDVELALVKSFGLPPELPSDWKDSWSSVSGH
jgi:hypothetical protein